MKKVIIVVSGARSLAHARLAAAALQNSASGHGYAASLEIQHPQFIGAPCPADEIEASEFVALAADTPVDLTRFSSKRTVLGTVATAIRNPDALLGFGPASRPTSFGTAATQGKHLIGITSCPTGIAHTFLAASALKRSASALGHHLRIETQGSVGARDTLTAEEIARADAVIIAADTGVDVGRFAGLPIHSISTKEAIRDPAAAITAALAIANRPREVLSTGPATPSLQRPKTGAYRHLMTGVSHLLPLVVAGGLAIALAFAVGGIYAASRAGSLGASLSTIGSAAFSLMTAVLAGYISFSIADRPGLVPGLIGGMLAQQLGAGFLGGIVAGFAAGYATRGLNRSLVLPASLEGLKPVLILPFIASIAVGLLMIQVVAPPLHGLLEATTAWLNRLRGTNALLLGGLLGGMMAFDMGGPINKAAYTFAVGLLAAHVATPMAAVMAAGMTPPLGIALAVGLFRGRFDADERKAGAAALVLGLSFVTEGAIPFAAKDPLRVIPALVLGSATAGGLAMAAGVQLLVPHGGLFAALIPGAVTHLLAYLGALAAGAMVTAGALFAGMRRKGERS